MNLNNYFKQICIWKIFLMFFLVFTLSIILRESKVIPKYMSSVVTYAAMLFLFLGIFKFNNVNIYDEITKKITKQTKLNALIILILNLLFSVGLSFFILSFSDLSLLDNISTEINYLQIICNVILIVLLAPILEELIFRGVLLNRLHKWFNTTISIIISSMLFGILHDDIIGAFIFGICMCILYLKTKNILVPIYVHFFNNLISELPEIFSLFLPNNTSFQEINMKFSPYFIKIWSLILIITSGSFLILYLFKNWPKKIK
ncbi:lysostaphin resistance A-like protein (plasmid) [Clostridium perfringens]